jgi:hypothetical protein
MPASSADPAVAGPITAFLDLAEQSVQHLYKFWRNRPVSTGDSLAWERGRDDREETIVKLERMYLSALAAAARFFPGPEAEQRLGAILTHAVCGFP